MDFVLDASVSFAWAFEDEQNAIADHAAQLLQTGFETAYAPDIWWYEMRNILVVGERRGRISPASTALFLQQIARLRIELVAERDDSELLEIARRHKLAVYDAAYLALAQRNGLPLATLDKNLEAAAAAEGVEVLK